MKSWLQFVNESLTIPGLKIEDLIRGLHKPNANYKKIIASHFNTYEDYIDNEGVRTFKINDLTGDILQNHRVMLRVLILEQTEIESTVQNNLISYCMSEFYSNLPNSVNIFGIEIKPISFVNKKDLEFTFQNMLNLDEIIGIITKITGYNYNNQKDGYYIWSTKL